MKQFTFPSYLAYGKLDSETIHKQDGFSLAEYKIFQKKALEIKVKPGYACISTYFSEQTTLHTEHLTLEKAFKQHFLNYHLQEDPVFEFLSLEIRQFSKIYFQSLTDDPLPVYYFPGLCFFLIRIPIHDDYNIMNAITLMKGELLKPFFHKFYETKLIVHDSEEEVNISMLELLVPLAFIYDIINIIMSSNIMAEASWGRIIIQESTMNSILKSQVFNLYDNDLLNYTLFYSH